MAFSLCSSRIRISRTRTARKANPSRKENDAHDFRHRGARGYLRKGKLPASVHPARSCRHPDRSAPPRDREFIWSPDCRAPQIDDCSDSCEPALEHGRRVTVPTATSGHSVRAWGSATRIAKLTYWISFATRRRSCARGRRPVRRGQSVSRHRIRSDQVRRRQVHRDLRQHAIDVLDPRREGLYARARSGQLKGFTGSTTL
jgi:hypothetical protein